VYLSVFSFLFRFLTFTYDTWKSVGNHSHLTLTGYAEQLSGMVVWWNGVRSVSFELNVSWNRNLEKPIEDELGKLHDVKITGCIYQRSLSTWLPQAIKFKFHHVHGMFDSQGSAIYYACRLCSRTNKKKNR